MDDSFRTFLQSSKGKNIEPKLAPTKYIENRQKYPTHPRVDVLKDKVGYFCTKYGEVGMDALDDFFKESVEKFSGFKSNKIKSQIVDELSSVTESSKPMSDIERANAILTGDSSVGSKTQHIKDDPNDIMAKASAIMG